MCIYVENSYCRRGHDLEVRVAEEEVQWVYGEAKIISIINEIIKKHKNERKSWAYTKDFKLTFIVIYSGPRYDEPKQRMGLVLLCGSCVGSHILAISQRHIFRLKC